MYGVRGDVAVHRQLKCYCSLQTRCFGKFGPVTFISITWTHVFKTTVFQKTFHFKAESPVASLHSLTFEYCLFPKGQHTCCNVDTHKGAWRSPNVWHIAQLCEYLVKFPCEHEWAILALDIHPVSSPTAKNMHVILKSIPCSASFLAEILVTSPRYFLISIIKKNVFWLKLSKKYVI